MRNSATPRIKKMGKWGPNGNVEGKRSTHKVYLARRGEIINKPTTPQCSIGGYLVHVEREGSNRIP